MKRYFQREDKQSGLLSSIKTKMEESTIDDITNIKEQKLSEEERNKSGIYQLHPTGMVHFPYTVT